MKYYELIGFTEDELLKCSICLVEVKCKDAHFVAQGKFEAPKVYCEKCIRD